MSMLVDRRRILMTATLLLAPDAALSASRRIRILIIDGVSNHDWQMTTRMLRAILEPTGLFDVSVSTSPPTARPPSPAPA